MVDKSFETYTSRQKLWDRHMQTWALKHIGRHDFETNIRRHELWNKLIDKSFKIDIGKQELWGASKWLSRQKTMADKSQNNVTYDELHNSETFLNSCKEIVVDKRWTLRNFRIQNLKKFMQIDFGTKEVWPLKKSKCSLDPRHKK